ncbi:MAG: glycosyltransferase family 4 protein [Bacteroidales bacterium]|nr:glycosyltransferase family 4 protein [Bacteroidales bacterium]
MKEYLTYLIVFVLLFVVELVYFRIADRFNIIDKPNERSSHTRVVLRGGGIIFGLGLWVWSAFFGFQYPWLLAAMTLAAGVSFIDDIHSLPDSIRLVAQFVAMGLLLLQLDMWHWSLWWVIPLALIVCVGATNIYNFMDGINGITGGYSLAVLLPLFLTNKHFHFIDESLLVVIALAVLVFCLFNYRTKAKCFAGDVGSVGIAFILLFCIGKLVMQTGDVTWLLFLIVYGVDGCLTIIHRIMLHENLGNAHRKHAYQLMANELHLRHVLVSTIYAALQLSVSLIMVYAIPDTVAAHWRYLIAVVIVLAAVYALFMKKYYHLHEEYLKNLE